MPHRVPQLSPKGRPDAGKLYERAKPRQEDKNFYSSAAWLRLRDLVRVEEPLCRPCQKEGKFRPTEAIDHIIDRKKRPELALDRSNLQGLCKACHNAKRAK